MRPSPHKLDLEISSSSESDYSSTSTTYSSNPNSPIATPPMSPIIKNNLHANFVDPVYNDKIVTATLQSNIPHYGK